VPSTWPRAECYAPPRSAPPIAGRHATAGSLFQNCRVVSFYGATGGGAMGILGSGPPDEVIPRLVRHAQDYTDMAPERPAVPALHPVAAVAQGAAQADGSYLLRQSPEGLDAWLALAEAHDLLLFLDLHLGRSSVAAEMDRLAPYLAHPRVHVALDPEFAMPPGVVPGQAIGHLDGADVNEAQDRLQALVGARGLPNKILVVHQFLPEMLPDRAAIADYPNVDLVIVMDGFGPPEAKTANYAEFVGAGRAEFGGIKLFFTQDPDLMTPSAVLELAPQPDVIIYQ
jgi:hypothetical protein